MNPRLKAVEILVKVIRQKRSLSQLFEEISTDQGDQALIKTICFGVLRHYFSLTFISHQFLQTKLRGKDTDIFCIILVGLYQIIYLRVPNHAAVFETVNCAKLIKKTWAVKLINAVLRSFLKHKDSILEKLTTRLEAYYNHPQWLIDMLKQAYPSQWQTILQYNNQQALMSLRVNLRKISQEAYLKKLAKVNLLGQPGEVAPSCVHLQTPCEVAFLPDFYNGYVSVQDQAAQLAAILLDVQPDQHVLDACAAPGGKTAHLLEMYSNITLDAVDIDADRCQKIRDNLNRLSLNAHVMCADVADIQTWWNGKLYDRILLDAPCSATGVIRRHPDIKLLRQAVDIPTLAQQQKRLLMTLWPLLKKGGLLLYATCSVLPQENEQVIQDFLKNTTSVVENHLSLQFVTQQRHGIQIFPGTYHMDGFYYCRLQKIY